MKGPVDTHDILERLASENWFGQRVTILCPEGVLMFRRWWIGYLERRWVAREEWFWDGRKKDTNWNEGVCPGGPPAA